jgi:multidrug efflux system membrane fusion protein
METEPISPETSITAARRKSTGSRVVVFVIILFAILLAAGLIPRLKLQPQLAAEAKTAPTIVSVTKITKAPSNTHLDLPGNITASDQTAINARANGYLRRWYVDIGDHVKAGQVLALIETPDTDQQVKQAQAQMEGSAASVQQSHANFAMMQANAEEAQANLSRSGASYQQAKTDLARAKAAVAQGQQAVAQQRAQVKSAQASADLAKATADRYAYLVKQGAIDQQTADQQATAYKTNQANVEALQASLSASQANVVALQQAVHSSEANVKAFADGIRASQSALDAAKANAQASKAGITSAVATLSSNQANLQRYNVLQGFQQVVAPFDGIITARNAEVGALVSAAGNVSTNDDSGANSSSTAALFSISRTDTVRIFVSVPQPFVDLLQPGQSADVTVQSLGSTPFRGKIMRNASALDAQSRTLSTEIRVSNPKGLLRPGMFATVAFTVHQPMSQWRIPDTALLTDAQGTHVAIVTPDHKLHFQPVEIGRDYGKEMDVTSGLNGTETLVASPNLSLQEGMTVQTVAAPTDDSLTSKGAGKHRRKG